MNLGELDAWRAWNERAARRRALARTTRRIWLAGLVLLPLVSIPTFLIEDLRAIRVIAVGVPLAIVAAGAYLHRAIPQMTDQEFDRFYGMVRASAWVSRPTPEDRGRS